MKDRRRHGRSIWAASLLLASMTTATATSAEEAPLWTEEPVRIDRDAQTFERIAAERIVPSMLIRLSARVAVLDSASFVDNGQSYVLADAIPVDPKRLCRSEKSIVVCGRQARIFLRRLIANRTLECDQLFTTATVRFVRCNTGGNDLAETLIGKGAAWTATPALQSLQAEAIRDRRGIWTDTACAEMQRCPGTGRELRR